MKEILINCGYTQKSGVILNGGELEDVFIEHDGSGGVGNIYKGTVDNVVPGMQSAFVDIGLDTGGGTGAEGGHSPACA